ncbi:hypothetical protein KC675_05385 [Candidatus Dojkabacteria bacterium]|uniref:Uncharacterized protein n=1 Tax=Candidatus Dojkabacteria bacterium TaxID=2099670 RepID=A0A955L052_9BACT|nr:hypothetical protein [Candidatus Dojkabacteria bacterium]
MQETAQSPKNPTYAQNTNQNGNSLKYEITELNKNLQKLTHVNRKRNVILRGLLNGVFTAIGASIGFALFLTGFSNFMQTAASIPLLDRLIERSHLDQIIEGYLDDFERPTPTVTPIPTVTKTPPTSTPKPTVTISPTEEPRDTTTPSVLVD